MDTAAQIWNRCNSALCDVTDNPSSAQLVPHNIPKQVRFCIKSRIMLTDFNHTVETLNLHYCTLLQGEAGACETAEIKWFCKRNLHRTLEKTTWQAHLPTTLELFDHPRHHFREQLPVIPHRWPWPRGKTDLHGASRKLSRGQQDVPWLRRRGSKNSRKLLYFVEWA